MTSWGESDVSGCDTTIFLTFDPRVRMRRLEAREGLRRRIEGLDPDGSKEFLEWSAGYDDPLFESRSLQSQEIWLERLPTPVLRLDTSQPVKELCRRVLDWEPGHSTSR